MTCTYSGSVQVYGISSDRREVQKRRTSPLTDGAIACWHSEIVGFWIVA